MKNFFKLTALAGAIGLVGCSNVNSIEAAAKAHYDAQAQYRAELREERAQKFSVCEKAMESNNASDAVQLMCAMAVVMDGQGTSTSNALAPQPFRVPESTGSKLLSGSLQFAGAFLPSWLSYKGMQVNADVQKLSIVTNGEIQKSYVGAFESFGDNMATMAYEFGGQIQSPQANVTNTSYTSNVTSNYQDSYNTANDSFNTTTTTANDSTHEPTVVLP